MSEPPVEPGWYSDPSRNARHEAYWDGNQWTRTRPSRQRRLVRSTIGWTLIIGSLGFFAWVAVDVIVGLTVTNYYVWEAEGPTVVGIAAMVGIFASVGVFIGARMIRTATKGTESSRP